MPAPSHSPEYKKAYYEMNKWRYRGYRLKKLYGITEEEYDDLLAAQDGACAICRKEKCSVRGTLAVDHEHGTGRIRGLLCQACNTLLGLADESSDRLIDAALYISKARVNG